MEFEKKEKTWLREILARDLLTKHIGNLITQYREKNIQMCKWSYSWIT